MSCKYQQKPAETNKNQPKAYKEKDKDKEKEKDKVKENRYHDHHDDPRFSF